MKPSNSIELKRKHTHTQAHPHIAASRSPIIIFGACLNAAWVNVMSYQLLLGCGGQTARRQQIANQLIQISLHRDKSLLIPL